MRARPQLLTTSLVVLLAAAGITAAVAADPAPPPPPKIAFLANGRVPADALAAGPIAGQLGAPVFTTEQDALSPEAAGALAGYAPELVIVLGGPVAIADAVIGQVAAATGLSVASGPAPTTGIVRAAGENRFATAAAVADLLDAYDPAYLRTDLQAVDSDMLDGRDSSAFAATPTEVVVPAAVFAADGFDPDSAVYSFGGQHWRGTAAAYGCMVGGVDVPSGHVPTSFTAWLTDNDALSTAASLRANVAGGPGVTLASVTTNGMDAGPRAFTDDTVGAPPAGAPTFYAVTVCLQSAEQRLHGVVVAIAPA